MIKKIFKFGIDTVRVLWYLWNNPPLDKKSKTKTKTKTKTEFKKKLIN